MRIALQPVGTRGDVEPMLVLGRALRARGHEVVFGAPEDHRQRVEHEGFPFHRVGVAVQARLRHLELQRTSKLKVLSEIRAFVLGAAKREVDEALAAADGCALVVNAGVGFGGFHAAEKLGVPAVSVFYAPGWLPSAAHAPVMLPLEGWPAFANRLLWRLSQRQGDGLLLGPVNAARARHALAPLDTMLAATPRRALLAFDPLFGAAPSDSRAVLPAWPEQDLVQVGALVDPTPRSLPPALEAFLAAGPPPVFLGFGSMADARAGQTAEFLKRLAAQHGVRFVWGLEGASAPVGAEATIFPVGELPYAAFFPRCRLVVHHGGAGTVATALRAGVPQLAIPHIADQFFFGKQLAAHGLGPAPIPRTRLSVAKLGAALASVLGEEAALRERCAAAQHALPSDGVARAAVQLEAWAEAR